MDLITRISHLSSWANESRIRLYALEDDLDWRAISLYSQNQHEGIGYVAVANREVIAKLIEAMQYFVYGGTDSFSYVYWWYVHKGLYDKTPDITWEAIVEAWVKDDFKGRALTIATIDRMRQILWDEPFFVAWAARPEERE